MHNGHVDKDIYTGAVGGQTWSTKWREAVACDIKLNSGITYINELVPVQQFAQQNWIHELGIPVFVFLHFLEFLCYRHIDRRLSQAVLDEFQVFVTMVRHRMYVRQIEISPCRFSESVNVHVCRETYSIPPPHHQSPDGQGVHCICYRYVTRHGLWTRLEK